MNRGESCPPSVISHVALAIQSIDPVLKMDKMVSRILQLLDEDGQTSFETKILEFQLQELTVMAPYQGSGDATCEAWFERELAISACLKQTATQVKGLSALHTIINFLEINTVHLISYVGLREVHSFVVETLETYLGDRAAGLTGSAATMLYGQAIGLYKNAADIAPAVMADFDETAFPPQACMSFALGVHRSNIPLLETVGPMLLTIDQKRGASGKSKQDQQIRKDAFVATMSHSSRSSNSTLHRLVTQSVIDQLLACLQLSRGDDTEQCPTYHRQPCPGSEDEALIWACFMIRHLPVPLRRILMDSLAACYRQDSLITALRVASITCGRDAQIAICELLPSLVSWLRPIQQESYLGCTIEHMYESMPLIPITAMNGLASLTALINEKHSERFLDASGRHAVRYAGEGQTSAERAAARALLSSLLSAFGPLTFDIAVAYIALPFDIVLQEATLLQEIAILLPKLAYRTIDILKRAMYDILQGHFTNDTLDRVLQAMDVYPTDDPVLSRSVYGIVMVSLQEGRNASLVGAALTLLANGSLLPECIEPNLVLRTAQILLRNDVMISHLALFALSTPPVLRYIGHEACSIIFQSMQQTIEPSIKNIAARLLVHAITSKSDSPFLRPRLCLHVRQSLSLATFLQTMERRKAVVEACIVTCLLPALPARIYRTSMFVVGDILRASLSPGSHDLDNTTLSLVYQSLPFTARYSEWDATMTTSFAMDLLRRVAVMPQQVKYSAFTAIAKLFEVSRQSVNVERLEAMVHTLFAEGVLSRFLDDELKTLVSGMCGTIGGIERNPVAKRNSHRAIEKERALYTEKIALQSTAAQLRHAHGCTSDAHVSQLTASLLKMAISPDHPSREPHAHSYEALATFAILQHEVVHQAIPGLPHVMVAEITRAAQASKGQRPAITVSAASQLLASVLHVDATWISPFWRYQQTLLTMALDDEQEDAAIDAIAIILDSRQ